MKANTSSSLVSGAITTPSNKTTLHKRILSLAIIQALACGSSALHAATITVDSAADNVTVDGSCTLREAIAAANTDTGIDCTAGSGADTINFDNNLSGSTVTLGGTELEITSSLSIDGDLDDDGTPDIEINANDASRVINVYPASSSLDVTLEGLTISGGNSNSNAGGVRSEYHYGSLDGVNLTISNSVISDNTSTSKGVGVHLSGTNSVTVINSSISGNTTISSAGGIYSNYGNISLTNSTVSGNSANGPGQEGGGIQTEYGNITLTDSTVSNNTAEYSGGGIHSKYGNVTLANSTVSGNTSNRGYGGGIWAYSGDITLTDSTVSGNTSDDDGGGIRAYSGDITLTDSTVSGNTSDDDGGGTWSQYGNVTLTNSTVSGNTSNSSAGGIRMDDGNLALTNSTVSGNTTTGSDGGGIYMNTGNVTLTNSTVSGNTSTVGDGGGIWIDEGDLTLTNTTVSDNSADNSGGGIFANGAGNSTTFSMVNSILANSDTGGDCGGGFDIINGSNSLIEDGGTACSSGIVSGNITSLLTVDPQLGALADNGGATLTHLPNVGSPVIDAGDNINCGAALTITTDQRGAARDDGMCDIGAVEGDAPLPTVASVQLDSTTATVSEDGSTIILNLTRSGETMSAISVDYSTSDGTATAPGDYTANTNTLNFATGVTSQSVTINITDDSDVESDEDFTLTLSNVQLVSGSASVELGANAATTVTITDDDATPTTVNSNSSSNTLGLSPWWSVLMLTGWLRRKFKS